MKLHPGQVGAAGEHHVAAEIHVSSGYAVTFSGNMKGIDLFASDAEQKRKISIQVKCKTAGTWHANTDRDGHARDEDPMEDKLWVFVDLGIRPPKYYYIAPAWWVENDIHEHHSAYLAKHGGRRARGGNGSHHAIPVSRLVDWQDRWDVLGILPGCA